MYWWPEDGQVTETCSLLLPLQALRLHSLNFLNISTYNFYLLRSWMQLIQFLIFSFFISFIMSSSHLFFGLLSGRVNIGQHKRQVINLWNCCILLFNPLNAELNSICYLLALLAHHFFHVSRIRVKSLMLRLLMSYIHGAPILDVSRSHTTTQHSL